MASNIETAKGRGRVAILLLVAGWGLFALGNSGAVPPEVTIFGGLALLAGVVAVLLAVLALLRRGDGTDD